VEAVHDAQSAYRAFGPALVRKAERLLRNRDDAVDVVQNVFVDLLHRWNPEMDLPYLYKAVTNRCLNQLRDYKNRARLLERQGTAVAPQARVRCDEQILGLDLIVRLSDLIDEAHMQTLVCRFVDDMTQDETATHLGVSRKTIGKRLDRIRDEVRGLMAAGSSGAA
jgi:RNA polymerase sigma-70 factor, ECF subfamily